MQKDYYAVLGINRGANLNKIKKAYRTVVKRYHPDVAQNQESKERFLEIREAYETLSDETKRKRYDQELERQGSELRIRKVPDIIGRKTPIFDKRERVFSSTADEFFQGFLPGFFDTDKRRVREKDFYFEAVLSPLEAAEGGLYPVTVPVVELCPRCGKSGFWGDFFCPVCNGYGRVRSEKEFSLSIPPHVTHGTEIRLSLEDIGVNDVYLNLVVYIDPLLERF